ncbi:tetratricopeptide repeat protein [Geminocystis sp. NIES-3709]|uniref:tetratricopeptide repeat protein n=1 Tax=Geminocystis sp. NIES-3709 TaxID=1617448 RepID=UPI0005FC81FD|nr:tetratricopeptide repeat protein [Geminocystis sp. NIES-3709]BAQ63321.1 TPR domain protein [Geminocystis sp. NIES-3709]
MTEIEQKINTAIKGLTRRINLKIEHILMIENALGNPEVDNQIWEKYLNGNNTQMALEKNIYTSEMIKLLTLRAIILPKMLSSFLRWMLKKQNKNKEHFQISLDFQYFFYNNLSSQTPLLKQKIIQGIVYIFPNLIDQPDVLDGVIWLLKSNRNPVNKQNNNINWSLIYFIGLWESFYKDDIQYFINNALIGQYISNDQIRKLIKEDHDWQTIQKDIKQLWNKNHISLMPQYLVFAKLFYHLNNYYLSAFFYQVSQGNVPSQIFNAIPIHADIKLIKSNIIRLYGIQIYKQPLLLFRNVNTKNLLLIIFIIFAILLISPLTISSERLYKRGLNYAQNQQFDQAIEFYNKAIEKGLISEDILYQRALAYQRKKDYNRAIEDYRKVININNKNYNAYLNRGNIYQKIKEYDKAIYDYNQAIKINHKFIKAYINRASIYRILNQNYNAIDDYTTIINIDNQFLDAYKKRGDIYLKINQYNQAIFDYTIAIKLGDYDVHNYKNRGNAHYKLKQYKKAIDDYTKVIENNKNLSDIYFKRAYSYAQLGNHKKSIEDYKQVVLLEPNNNLAYNNRGISYQKLGKYQEALKDFDTAINLNNQHPYAYENRGDLYYYNLTQYNKAIYDYTQAIRVNNKNKSAYNSRGNVYHSLGQIQKAIYDYTQAIKIDNNYAQPYYNRASTHLKNNNKSQALNDFNRAAQLYQKQGKKEWYQLSIEKIESLKNILENE